MQIELHSQVQINSHEDFKYAVKILEEYIQNIQQAGIKIIGIYDAIKDIEITIKELKQLNADDLKAFVNSIGKIECPYLIVEINEPEDFLKIAKAVGEDIYISQNFDDDFQVEIDDSWKL